MKTTPAHLAIALLAVPALLSAEPEQNKPVVAKKPPTHTDLAKKQKQQEIERHGKDREPVKPIVTIKKRDLFAMSTLFNHNGNWAMVPKRAVIYAPPRLKNKIVDKPKGRLLRWPLFLQKYGGLFHTHEVTMEQAKGKKSINPKAIEAYQGTGKIVVATYRRQPITVHADAFLTPEQRAAKKEAAKAPAEPSKTGPQ